MITAEGGSKAIAAAGLTTYNLGGVLGGMVCAWAVTRFGSRIPLVPVLRAARPAPSG
jgi:AAHS family 4-hydroxybenzoate transporter-like MFS transporter